MQRRKGLAVSLAYLTLIATGSGAFGQEAAKKDAPALSTRRPFATAGTPKQTERIRYVDVRHIKGELTIDTKAAEIRGTVTHTLAPLFPSQATVSLDCAAELKVAKVTVGGKTCVTERKGDTLVVTLDRVYAPGEAFDLAVTYSGSPSQGIYFIPPDESEPARPYCVWTQGEAEETRHWLPCYDFPNDRATSEMIVTVPKPMKVLSNGKLVETKENADGTATFHWKMDVPHVSYLISLAASEFNVYRDTHGTIPVEYWVLKNVDEPTARRAMGKTPKMIAYFEELTGQPYPYAKYAQVVVPEFTQGGMENISATTLNEFALGDATSALERDADGLVSHELAHQWFGDLLTCRDWPHLWLNEGFASYFAPLFTEHDRGEDAFRLEMNGVMRGYMGMDSYVRRAMVEPRYKNTNDLFDGVTYSKGACVLHMLRGLIGEEAWRKGLRGYVSKHREQVVETDDFRKAMEAASGRDLAWFFDQWVFHGGHPELKARWRYEPEDKTVRLAVEQTQPTDDLTPLFRLPTTVEIDDGSAVKCVPVVIDGKTHEFVIPCPAAPKMVRIDPKGWLIKQLEFEKKPEEWLYQLEHAGDVLGRTEAARALAKLKDDPKALAALGKAWPREKEPIARAELVRQLATLGEPAKTALLSAVKDGDARVRAAAVRALAQLKADPELEAVLRASWSDPKASYTAREAALRGLAKWKVKDIDDLLDAGLKTHSDRDTIAETALGMLLDRPSSRSRELAVLYSRPGQPAPLRRTAISALNRLGKTDPQVEAALRGLVGDPSRRVRTSVWRMLSDGTSKATLEALEAQLKVESNPRARPELEKMVARLKDAQPKPATPAAAPIPSSERAAIDAIERQANDLETQARELRNKVQALKSKETGPRPAPASGAKS